MKENSGKSFLKTKQGSILDHDGRPVILRGVNLGGWLMMEGYILHALNVAEQVFKKNFTHALGKGALTSFEKDFRSHFIQEDDIKTIAGFGFNCIRVPFNSRAVEQRPYQYTGEGLKYLDHIVRWAEKYKVWLILDLHAACGAQNYDWHSDSLGRALLWQKKELRDRTFKLWEFLANRYKDKKAVAGYDLLNEAVLEDAKLLNAFYKQLIKTIRRVDHNHILFVEGNRWAQDLDCLEDFDDSNLALSVHTYLPMEYTFNFVPHLQYPRKTKKDLHKLMSGYARLAKKEQRPIYVGEFGVNARQGHDGEGQWVKDILSCFAEFGFHWTYWTYKAVKNSVFPDGIFSYLENPPWVNRGGPRLGWDTYSSLWPEHREQMIESWRTENFSLNTAILDALRRSGSNGVME